MRTPIIVCFCVAICIFSCKSFGQTPNSKQTQEQFNHQIEKSSRGSIYSSDPFSNLPEHLQAQIPLEWKNDQDFSHGFDGATIFCMAVDGDNLYLGGDFQTFDTSATKPITAYHIVAYNRQTKKWSSMGNGFNGAVYSLAIYNGKLYAGGNFSRPGNNKTSPSLQHIAVWTGSSWQPVGGGVDGVISAMAVLGNDLYIGGSFTKTGSEDNPYFARWNGSKWNFVTELNDAVRSLYVTHDSLFVGGEFWDGTIGLRGLGLWKNDTWDIVGGGVDGTITSITMHNGELWVSGDFISTWTDRIQISGVAIYDGNSWKFPGGSSGLHGGVVNHLISSGDSLIMLGNFSSIGEETFRSAAVWKDNKWHSLGEGFYGTTQVGGIFNGSLYIGGKYSTANGNRSENIVAINSSGWSNPGIARDGYNLMSVTAIAASDDYVYVAGQFTRIRDKVFNRVAAWNKKTKAWEALSDGINGDIRVLTVYGTDLYAGGLFTLAGGIKVRHIAKWNSTSKSWSAMGDGSVRSVAAIAADASGAYASVFFPFEENKYLNYLGKWNGSAWEQIPGGLNSYINDIEVQGSQLFVAGGITRANETPVRGIAVYDNGEWQGLGDGSDGWVYDLKWVGSKLYAAGAFTSMDGVDALGIAMWEGTSWQPLGSGVNDYVYHLTASNDNLYVAGYPTLAGDKTVSRLAMWNGSEWFDVDKGTDNTILALASDNHNLYVGGYFGKVGNENVYRLGQFSLDVNEVKPHTSPIGYQLAQNYPNPFNPSTQIRYTLDERSYVKLVVSDPLGREVSTLVDGWVNAGDQEVTFNALDLPSGCYTYALTVNGNTISRKMLLSK